MPILQDFLKSMPHYAIWDDHDYGWNDADGSYPLKQSSRDAFKAYWANPSYGVKDDAIYTKFTWNDVDVFLLDDRWYRSNDNMKDSVNGKPNPDKQMFGKEQIQWLKNALVQSNSNPNINFRIIATGSQMLNHIKLYDCFLRFPAEYYDLLDFLTDNKINGVVFFTGDRHHSEIIKRDRKDAYPLFDITSSPLTSGTHSFGGVEKDNPDRVLGIDKLQNYTRVSFIGKSLDRKMQVEFLGINGELINSWSISQKELRSPK
jgi:alkaline phosphatase D